MKHYPPTGKHFVIIIVFLFISTVYVPVLANEKKSDLDINNIEIEKKNIDKQLDSFNNNFLDNRFFYNAYNYPIHIRDFRYNKATEKKVNNNQEKSSSSINPSISFKASGNSNVIYVPDDYPSIQSAVDNATAGDTIIVRDGTYTESIVIDKPLAIQSEKGYTNCTIFQNGGTYIITITSDFVKISGFKIIGLNSADKSGICINNVNNTTISWNMFARSYYFIIGTFTNYNTIHDNLMGSSGSYIESWGIWLRNSDNNLIYNNEITGLDMYAVPVHLESSNNNTVTNNILSGSYDMGLLSSENNTIMNNIMGSGFWAQIYMEGSSYNTFQNNTFYSADYDGVEIYSSSHNTFSNNTLTKGGIFVYESYNNIIKDNIINNKPLIYLEGISDYFFSGDAGQIVIVNCNNMTISNQNISQINQGLELFKTNDSIIFNCNFSSNKFQGIYSAFSDNNKFINITLKNNWGEGIYLYNCNETEISYSNINPNWGVGICTLESHYAYFHNNTIKGRDCNGIEMISSNYNTICFNEITHHVYGFTAFMIEDSHHNNIFNNNINSNSCGFFTYNCKNLSIYHNAFIGNKLTEGENDGENNSWDNGYPSGGNYWSDYTGKDNDRDGIGDTPNKIISSGSNWDRYPLMEPYGNFRANNNGPYFDFKNNPIQFKGFVCCGTPPYTWFWDFGDGITSVEQNPIHTYTNTGKYTIYLSVTDNVGNTSNHTSWATIQITNDPPNKPTINGPTRGDAGKYYNYTFVSEDPDETEVRYYIDWGDGQITEWAGWYVSGEVATFGHIWSKRGWFTIRAKAVDGYNEESDWATLRVRMPRNKGLFISHPLLNWLLERFPNAFPILRFLLDFN